jgi:hypothetical protein
MGQIGGDTPVLGLGQNGVQTVRITLETHNYGVPTALKVYRIGTTRRSAKHDDQAKKNGFGDVHVTHYFGLKVSKFHYTNERLNKSGVTHKLR